MGPLLLIFLFAILAALEALYEVSRGEGIHQSAFVYQFNLKVHNSVTTLAPYSIVPTLLAVLVKLWFEAIGETFKRLRPYTSMATTAATASSSILVEYANTPLAITFFKATKNSKWMLTLVGLAGFATEACEYSTTQRNDQSTD